MGIDWNALEGDFVEISAGIPKKLVITNWRNQDKFKDEETQQLKKGLTFDVIKEDDRDVTKEWTLTAGKAIKQLKPLIMRAEQTGKTSLSIQVIKVGEGQKTVYQINEI